MTTQSSHSIALRGVLLTAVLGSGCTNTPREATVLPIDAAAATCDPANARSLDELYDRHLAPSLSTGCAVAGCHATGAGGFEFRDAHELWEAAVGKAATRDAQAVRIVPGDPDRSLLVQKLLPGVAERMPQGGPYLDDAAIAEIAAWICAGAAEPRRPAMDAGVDGPTVSSIAPASVEAGSGSLTLTIDGTGFVAGSRAQLDGANLPTTFATTTRITATVDGELVAAGGTHTVTVVNPSPGGGASAPKIFTVNNPVPAIASITPTRVATNGAPLTLAVSGSGFTRSSTVHFNGTAAATAFVGTSMLSAQIPSIDAPGSYPIVVVNPTPGGGASNSALLTAAMSTSPTISGLSPSVGTANTAFALTVSGGGYICAGRGSDVIFNGSPLASTSCSTTQLVVTVPATAAGDYSIQVETVAGGELSNSVSYHLAEPNPVPTITALAPSSVSAGGAGFALTIDGAGFVPSASVRLNGTAKSTTFVSDTRLTAAISAGDIASTGSYPVTVVNPAPGGGTSNTATLTANSPNPVPVISALSPCGGVAGGSQFTLTIDGTNFASGATATFNGVAISATYIDATRLTATIPAAQIASAPTDNVAAVLVTNPAPGGGASNTAYFGVATKVSTLAANVQPIFNSSCTGGGCHSTAGSVNLTSGRAYGSLVGVKSGGCSSKYLVLACAPLRSQSVLVDKILATTGSPPCSGSPMPKTGSITTAQKQAIVDWVAQGAPQ